MGFVGSERTTRRVVARLKHEYVRSTHRIYKPWVTEPGMWLQFDYGKGPVVGRSADHAVLCLAGLVPLPGGARPRRPDLPVPRLGVGPDAADDGRCADLPAHRQREDGDHPARGRSGRPQPGDPGGGPLLRGGDPHLCGGRPRVQGRQRVERQAGQGRRPAPPGQPGGRLSRLLVPRAGLCGGDPALQHPGAPRDRRTSGRSAGGRAGRAARHPRRALLGGPG